MAFGVSDANFLRKDVTKSFSSSSSSFDFFEYFDSDTKKDTEQQNKKRKPLILVCIFANNVKMCNNQNKTSKLQTNKQITKTNCKHVGLFFAFSHLTHTWNNFIFI